MNNKKEIWKEIEGFGGMYKVSSLGNIYSYHNYRGIKPGLKKPSLNKQRGYMYVDLFKKSEKGKMFSVHRLVAKHFVPNPNNYPTVNHKDGNKLNNNANNLEWCTQSYNNYHAFRMGLHKSPSGENQALTKLKEKDIHKIFELKAQRKTHVEIGKELGIPESTVAHIATRRSWKYVKLDKRIEKKIEANKHRWALKYDRCICCKRSDIRHNGLGLCENCYAWGINNNKLVELTKGYVRNTRKTL